MNLQIASVLSSNTIVFDLLVGYSGEPINDGTAKVTVVDAESVPIPGLTWPQDMIRDPAVDGRYILTLPPQLFPEPKGLHALITAMGKGLELALDVPYVVLVDQGGSVDYREAWAFAVSEGIIPPAGNTCH